MKIAFETYTLCRSFTLNIKLRQLQSYSTRRELSPKILTNIKYVKNASMTNKKQPEWHAPVFDNSLPTLKIYNSLTRTKVDFIPKNGKQISWYNCGPTVYDASHLGHARLYVTIDFIRRILTDYFNYDILFVMNITDIDDKIILRARKNYLFNNFKSTIKSLTPELIEQIRNALNDFTKSKLGVMGDGIENNTSRDDPKYLLYANSFREAVKALVAAEVALEDNDTSQEAAHQLLNESQEIISEWLDKKDGASITDQKVFRDLAATWEQEFINDMQALNVRPCDIMTRVSEYVPEIAVFIQKIIDNGFAYEADGSVYFDTVAFNNEEDHHYAKLEPWSANNEGLIEEGEGSLGSKLLGKRNKGDFALWKKSKSGEPSWDSPWGFDGTSNVREIFGDYLDIHSGGIDLAFPHHDNEIAQSEAYHGCQQWVNYFLHVGHLNIEGQKMSKSLKNFISIRVKKHTARQLRLCFLLHQWDSKLDFKESTMGEAKGIETILNNFFVNTKALLNEFKQAAHESDGTHRYNASEKELMNLLREKQSAVHKALCDSLNTPTVMSEIMELINKTNIYVSAGRNNINMVVLENIAKYVTNMLKIFGVIGNTSSEDIGFGESEQSIINREEVVLPYLRVLSSFRDSVRELARQQKGHGEFLALSDKLRDTDLVNLGVSLDDQEDGKALVKFVDKDVLIKAREAKLQLQAEKAAKKEAAAKAKEEERKRKLEKGKLAAEDMFKEEKDEDGKNLYSAFDEQGIPTHDNNGEEISKSKIKKLKQKWEIQKKLNDEYLAYTTSDN
ncbi:303_t:CDS:10 [Dentiscutata erythropus]|uniref:cysteine--tRNA ligase n=1 Tax=Dentiscutata erythropus TaxID=1348616 RepID=A0A9N9G3G5_9GLOM|nr:303_t:CDS:10 [Dentiscutata erythropus]